MYVYFEHTRMMEGYFLSKIGSDCEIRKIRSIFQPILIKFQDTFYFKNFSKNKLLEILEARVIAGLVSTVTPKESMQ